VTQPKVDLDTRVDQYVKLRDKIKEIEDKQKEAIRPYKEALDQLNNTILSALDQIGVESVRTQYGTAYRLEKKSASFADKEAFWTFVVATGQWDLLDYKANVTAVKAFIDKQIEEKEPTPVPPPGVNYSVRYEVGVRRK
jgi:hypothetical protein